MADATLNFKIGSTFSGAGFQAANKEIENASKVGKKLSRVLGNIVGEAQKVDGTLGQIAGTAGTVINGFSQLGIIGGIMAGAKAAMDLFFESAKNGYDEMVKAAQKAAEEQKKALQKTVDQHIKNVADANNATKTMGQEAVKQFEEVANAAIRASQLVAQTDIARGNSSIANMQIEKLNAIINEETKAGKALVGAKYDVQIAMQKSALQEEQSNTAIGLAQQGVLAAKGRVEKSNNQLALAEQALAVARDEQNRLAHVRNADTSKLAQQVKTAEENYAAAKRDQFKSATELMIAEGTLKKTMVEQSTAMANAQAGILQAKIALDDVNRAEEEAAKARRKEAEAAEKAAKKKELQSNAEKRIEELQDDANGAIERLTNEMKTLTEEIKDINDNRGKMKTGVATGNLQNPYNWGVDKDGVPDNFIDWNRAVRFFERSERDRKTREKRDDAYQKRMRELQEKLEKRGEKALTEREKAQMKAWKEYQEAKHGREKREQEIKQKQETIDRLRKQLADDVRLIKKDLKQALELV